MKKIEREKIEKRVLADFNSSIPFRASFRPLVVVLFSKVQAQREAKDASKARRRNGRGSFKKLSFLPTRKSQNASLRRKMGMEVRKSNEIPKRHVHNLCFTGKFLNTQLGSIWIHMVHVKNGWLPCKIRELGLQPAEALTPSQIRSTFSTQGMIRKIYDSV